MAEKSCDGIDPELNALLTVYQIASEQWAHAEQVRWTVLYNFLVANTILLLAWGAVFGTTQSAQGSPRRTFILLIFCIAGAIISITWVGLGQRANNFIKHYSVKACNLEAALPEEWRLFAATEEFRRRLQGSEGWVSTRRVVLFIPGTFFVLFVLLACLSIKNEISNHGTMTETAIAWASVVNAVLVAVLVGVTIWYAVEASKARKATERQAAASEASLRALRREADLQMGVSRTIVKTAIQTVLRNIECWSAKGKAYNLAVQHQLPKDVELLPLNADRAVEHARGISVEGSEELSSSFDSLRLAQLQLHILQDPKQTSPEFFQTNTSELAHHLEQASLALRTAQARFRENSQEKSPGVESQADSVS